MLDDSSTALRWEQETIQTVLLEHLREQRQARRWGIFFKLAILVIMIALLGSVYAKDRSQTAVSTREHTAVVNIYGAIAADEEANADSIRDALRSAFQNKQAKGVVLRINSPGGSPVQARQVYSEIRALRKQYPNTKVYAAIEDMGTSAAYLIACAADHIYADETSLVGSIGVKMESFGFVDLLQKAGIERRAYIAGKYKDILDPFLPMGEVEKQHILEELKLTHEAFIQNVREGRGKRLEETDLLFSGLFWSGTRALKLGLIDGFGDADYVAQTLVQAKELVDYTPDINLIDKLTRRMGASLGAALSGMHLLKQGLH
jgi:protease IV